MKNIKRFEAFCYRVEFILLIHVNIWFHQYSCLREGSLPWALHWYINLESGNQIIIKIPSKGSGKWYIITPHWHVQYGIANQGSGCPDKCTSTFCRIPIWVTVTVHRLFGEECIWVMSLDCRHVTVVGLGQCYMRQGPGQIFMATDDGSSWVLQVHCTNILVRKPLFFCFFSFLFFFFFCFFYIMAKKNVY